MIQSLSDILVVSDMDGTLLVNNTVLPRSNLETVRLFTMLGGRFTVATGRVAASVARYEQLAGCLCPGITSGGCVLYDFKNSQVLRNQLLPHTGGKRALREVLRAFPKVGVVIMAGDTRQYLVNASPYTQKLFNDERHTYYLHPRDELPEDWNKVLFAGEPELLDEVENFVSQKEYPGIYYIKTDKFYFEMMPKDVTKGTALQELCRQLSVPLENTIYIGDYYNDVDVMKLAGHSVAMGNAPREIKVLADETTGPADEGGVGQYLYKLIRQYG